MSNEVGLQRIAETEAAEVRVCEAVTRKGRECSNRARFRIWTWAYDRRTRQNESVVCGVHAPAGGQFDAFEELP